MKNLNTLVEEMQKEFYKNTIKTSVDFPKGTKLSGTSISMFIADFTKEWMKKIAEKALKECRPEKKNEKGTGIYKDMLGIEEMVYNQCLSDYDEKVKQFLQ